MKQRSINTLTNYPPRGSKLKEELKHQTKKVKPLHETITIKLQNHHHPREQKKRPIAKSSKHNPTTQKTKAKSGTKNHANNQLTKETTNKETKHYLKELQNPRKRCVEGN